MNNMMSGINQLDPLQGSVLTVFGGDTVISSLGIQAEPAVILPAFIKGKAVPFIKEHGTPTGGSGKSAFIGKGNAVIAQFFHIL